MPIPWTEEQIDNYNSKRKYDPTFKWLRLYIDWDSSSEKYSGSNKLKTLFDISKLFNPKAKPSSGSSTRQDLEGREFHVISLPLEIKDAEIASQLQQHLPSSEIKEISKRTFKLIL